MKQNLKRKNVCKIICFFLLPIMIASAILLFLEMIFIYEYPESKTSKNYFESEGFSNSYLNEVYSNTYHIEQNSYTLILSDQSSRVIAEEIEYYDTEDGKIQYNANNYYRNSFGFHFLIIDNEKGISYTNYEQTTKTDTIQKIKQQLQENEIFWNLENENISTNIDLLTLDNIKYDGVYKEIQEYLKGKEIYTSYNTNLDVSDSLYIENTLYTIANATYKWTYVLFPITVILSLIMSVYLILYTGKTKRQEEIHLDWFDKLPLELAVWVGGIVLTLLLVFIAGITNAFEEVTFLFIIDVVLGYLASLVSLYAMGSIIKRVRSKTFFKNTYCYRILSWIRKNIKSFYDNFVYNINTNLKIVLTFIIFLSISYLLTAIGGFGVFLAFVFWGYCIYFIIKRVKEFNKIKEALKDIYDGKENIRVDETILKGVLKEVAVYLNDISGGLANAVEQSLKSERLKTELITNVSHDLKTPLTSIINYVDLLKKENIKNEKVKEYIEVLEQKAQRLKKLTEDLVEASKASSGNIKLNKERLKVKELLNQVSGEFEDRFHERDLEVVLNFPKEEVCIYADSRYMYRVLENMYSNISKYALSGSRVYIDVITSNDKVLITLKNISSQKLNITTEELMQRFVRGDSSRNTEGSGLGLSIAESLTQIQDGIFDINIDGDLFKVIIQFKKV